MINDTYGHDSGDIILKNFASLLKQYTREEDFCARLSGDEFAIIMNCSFEQAILIDERIKQKPVLIYNGNVLHYGASFGFTRYCGHKDVESLLAQADATMYSIKKIEKKN